LAASVGNMVMIPYHPIWMMITCISLLSFLAYLKGNLQTNENISLDIALSQGAIPFGCFVWNFWHFRSTLGREMFRVAITYMYFLLFHLFVYQIL
jgi:hypothetical protein